MAGKHLPSSFLHRRFRSPLVLFPLLLLLLLLFVYFLFFSSLFTPFHDLKHPASYSTKTETSFLVSLERFLAHRSSSMLPRNPDDTADPATDDDVGNLDDGVFASESDRLRGDPYYPLDLPLRVYVYEMPRKFTYDLLLLFWNTYKETSNLTSNGSPVHRLIEQVFTLF